MARPHRLLALALIFACRSAQAEPEEALKRFLSDLRNHRADAAWAALSSETRAELTKRHEARAQAMGQPPKPQPARMLYDELGLTLLNPPENIAIVSPPGERLVLRVAVKDGISADVRMVKEADGWKVDLLATLKDAPPLEAGLGGQGAPEKPAEEAP